MKHIDSSFFYDPKIPCHMNFLNLEIYYLIPEFEDKSAEREYYKQVAEADKEYDQYLIENKEKIKNKLYKLYFSQFSNLDKRRDRLHDFLIKQIAYIGNTLYTVGYDINGYCCHKQSEYDSVKLILDAHNGYDYELSFGKVVCFNMNHNWKECRSGIEDIIVCEIGVVEDIPKCNYFSCVTSTGGEVFIAFKQFNCKAIPCKK